MISSVKVFLYNFPLSIQKPGQIQQLFVLFSVKNRPILLGFLNLLHPELLITHLEKKDLLFLLLKK